MFSSSGGEVGVITGSSVGALVFGASRTFEAIKEGARADICSACITVVVKIES